VVLLSFSTSLGAEKGSRLTLVFSGRTYGALEPCGCRSNQSGGLTRRATVIENVFKRNPQTLLLEGGGIFRGLDRLDKLRTEVYLKALEKMGYHAIAIGKEEFTFGTEFIKKQIKTLKIPFLSANTYMGETRGPLGIPYLIKEVGNVKVGILGLTAPISKKPKQIQAQLKTKDSEVEVQDPFASAKEYLPIIKDKADLIIVLSDLSQRENRILVSEFTDIDVILASRGKVPIEKINHTFIISPKPRYLTRLDLWVNDEGRVLSHNLRQILLSQAIAQELEIKKLISRFYERVAKDKSLQALGKPKLSDQDLEQDKDNGYVGALACLSCHEKEYHAWKRTRHSWAFNTLINAQRYFYPDCVSCHSTGFGYVTGFKIDQSKEHLKGVQCEVCHGPGKRHIANPEMARLRDTIPITICLECHDRERTPHFEQQKAFFLARIDHKALAQRQRSLLVHSKTLGENQPHITLSEESWDFGTISQGDKVSRKFKIFNAGKGILKINQVRTSCGCTAAIIASKTIKPAENTEIEVTFRSGKREGRVIKYIFIDSNDPDEPHKRITITGFIKKAEPYKPAKAKIVGLYLFGSNDSKDCKEIKEEFIPKLKERYNVLQVQYFPIDNPTHYGFLLILEGEYQVMGDEIPVIFISDQVLRGKEEIEKHLEKAIKECLVKERYGWPKAALGSP